MSQIDKWEDKKPEKKKKHRKKHPHTAHNVPLTPAQNIPDSLTVDNIRVDGDLDVSFFDSMEPDQEWVVNPPGVAAGEILQAVAPTVEGNPPTWTPIAPAAIAVTTDGNPPASSPSLATGVYAGSEFFALKWTGVANADPVKYEVHASTTPSFTPTLGDAATLVATTPASLIFIRKDASGASFQSGIMYYFRIIAFDGDPGAAAAGTVGSGILEATGGGANLLRDGDMEAEDTINTVLSNARLSCAGSIDIEETIVFHGSRSCKIVSSGAGGGLLGLDPAWFDGSLGSEAPKVIEGQPYTFSAWHYNAEGSTRHARAVIQWLDAGFGAVGSSTTSDLVDCPPDTWVRAQVTATAPVGAVYGWPETGFTDLANTEIGYVDAMQFEQGEVATAFSTFSNQGVFREVIVAGEIIAEHFEAVLALVSSLVAGTAGAERVEIGFGTDSAGDLDPSFIGIRAFRDDGVRTLIANAETGEFSVYGDIDFGADASNPSRLTNSDYIELAPQVLSGSYQTPAIVQTKSVFAESGTAGGTFDAPTTDGNVTLAFLFIMDDDGTNPTPTTPSSPAWTLDSSTTDVTVSGGSKEGALFCYRKNATTSFSTLSITLNDTVQWSLTMMEVSGITNAAPPETTSDTGYGDPTPTLTSTGTLGAANNLALIVSSFFLDVRDSEAAFTQASPTDYNFGASCYNDYGGAGLGASGKMYTQYMVTSATTALAPTLDENEFGPAHEHIAKQLIYRAAAAPDTLTPPDTGRLKVYDYNGAGEPRLYAVAPGGPSAAGLTSDLMLPAGCLLPYAGSTAPVGFLLCYGQSLVRTEYASLFAAIGTTYGSADGTHFTLPDMRGRIPLTLDNMGGSDAGRLTMANTLGLTGGEEKHQLSVGELAQHGHSLASGEGGTAYRESGTGSLAAGSTTFVRLGGTNQQGRAENNGSDTAHNNLQPYVLMNYIIKF